MLRFGGIVVGLGRRYCALFTLTFGITSASATSFTPVDGNQLEAMTGQQRIAYLADAYEAVRQNPSRRPLVNEIFRDVVQPTFVKIARYDGAPVAAKLYAVTFGGVLQQPNSDWEVKAKLAAQADSAFLQLISVHPFPKLNLGAMEIAGLQDTVTRELIRAAERGDAQSCQLMATSTRHALWNSKAAQGCLAAAYPAGRPARWLDIPEGDLRNQAMNEEAVRRGKTRKSRDISAAQEVARYCATVGINSVAIDPNQARALAVRWDRQGIENLLLPYGPMESTLERHVDDLSEVYARKVDAYAIFGGSAVTPVLTPMLYMAIAKPQCGLQ